MFNSICTTQYNISCRFSLKNMACQLQTCPVSFVSCCSDICFRIKVSLISCTILIVFAPKYMFLCIALIISSSVSASKYSNFQRSFMLRINTSCLTAIRSNDLTGIKNSRCFYPALSLRIYYICGSIISIIANILYCCETTF